MDVPFASTDFYHPQKKDPLPGLRGIWKCWFQNDLKNRFYFKDAVYFGHEERLIKFYSYFEKSIT